MNFNNITIGIVSFKSEKVIFNCLNSIKKIKKIIILDNSNDFHLKKKLKKYILLLTLFCLQKIWVLAMATI